LPFGRQAISPNVPGLCEAAAGRLGEVKVKIRLELYLLHLLLYLGGSPVL